MKKDNKQRPHNTTNEKMDFAYFLLGIITNILYMLRDVFSFICAYVIPIINILLPIAFDNLCLLATICLTLFFKYLTPCLVIILDLIGGCFTQIIKCFGWLCVTFIEFDCQFLDRRFITFAIIIVALFYYRRTQCIIRFLCEGGKLIALNTVFLIRFSRIILDFGLFIYEWGKEAVIRHRS